MLADVLPGAGESRRRDPVELASDPGLLPVGPVERAGQRAGVGAGEPPVAEIARRPLVAHPGRGELERADLRGGVFGRLRAVEAAVAEDEGPRHGRSGFLRRRGGVRAGFGRGGVGLRGVALERLLQLRDGALHSVRDEGGGAGRQLRRRSAADERERAVERAAEGEGEEGAAEETRLALLADGVDGLHGRGLHARGFWHGEARRRAATCGTCAETGRGGARPSGLRDGAV